MRILVVEDDHRISSSIKRGLEQESMAVDVAFDGEDGYDLAESEDYDVIVLDLMLPKLDGISVVKKLRKEANIHTPVLILTAKGEIHDKVNGLESGADDYLAKPFAFTELIARIKALSRRPKVAVDTVLKADSLTLNTNTYQVKRNGLEINLSKKEYALLEYMLRNKDKTLTKDMIIGNVWNYDDDILPNTVEVYVGYLRKKIDSKFNKKLIKTIRGFGYKIEDK